MELKSQKEEVGKTEKSMNLNLSYGVTKKNFYFRKITIIT